MNFRQLVFKNILRNARVYLSYFLSSVFSIFVFFTAAILYFHPALEGDFLDGNTRLTAITLYFTTNSLFGFALLVIAILSLIFLGSMFFLFLKERQQNFSLYMMLGMTRNNLRKMIALENSLVGMSSITVGIVIGVIFSKFILLIGQNILGVDQPLTFYFPTEAIALTLIVYLFVFIGVTLLTLSFFKTSDGSMTLNIFNKSLKDPKTNDYLIALGIVSLFLTYSMTFLFVKVVKWSSLDSSLKGVTDFTKVLLIGAASFFCLGLYLFFQQLLIQVVNLCRKYSWRFKSDKLFVFSSLAYRLKANSTLYFLITFSALFAFFTITGTVLLSKVELYGTNEENTLAYTYRAYNVKNQADWDFHDETLAGIKKIISKSHYSAKSSRLDDSAVLTLNSHQYIPDFYDDRIGVIDEDNNVKKNRKLLFLMPLSEYNSMARFKGKSQLTLSGKHELVILSNKFSQVPYQYNGDVEFEGPKEPKVENVTFRFLPADYNAGNNLPNITVVADNFYQEIIKNIQLAGPRLKAEQLVSEPPAGLTKEEYLKLIEMPQLSYPFQIIHFKEWATSGSVDTEVRDYLRERQEVINERIDESEETYDPLVDDYTFFDYTSSYQTLLQRKNEQGGTFLANLLIGSVFFIFNACILYFRLFGELEQDSRYHRTLHLIGIPPKLRHQLITLEMAVMFFLPLTIAIINYLLVVWGLNVIIGINIWQEAFLVIGLFLVFQVSFFFISRRNYLNNVEYRVDKWQGY